MDTKPGPEEHNRQDYQYRERQIEAMPERTFRPGEAKISGYVSAFLGVMSFLAVLCYLFPSYLTTAELRAGYNADTMRMVLRVGIITSLAFGLLTFFLSGHRKLGAVGVLFSVAAIALGGSRVEAGPIIPGTLSVGLDWLILAFIFSAVLFIFLEKVFPKYKNQPILRPKWELDFFYFCLNHLLITILLLAANYFVATVFGWALSDSFQSWVRALPLLGQVVLLMVCADLVTYWTHRTFHEVPWLWKIHAVHHSSEYMDWMAGSRTHIVQTVIDRCLVFVPLYLIGADQKALDLYVSFAAFQAVYIHSNLKIPVGPLKYIFATPQYHHWHHSSERPAIDTNYVGHLPIIDRIFGTYHFPPSHWPADYGTTKPVPMTFWAQFLYPFRRDKPLEQSSDSAK